MEVKTKCVSVQIDHHLCSTVAGSVSDGDLNDYQRSYVNHGGKCHERDRRTMRNFMTPVCAQGRSRPGATWRDSTWIRPKAIPDDHGPARSAGQALQHLAAQWGYLRDPAGTTVWFHLPVADQPQRTPAPTGRQASAQAGHRPGRPDRARPTGPRPADPDLGRGDTARPGLIP